MSISRIVFIIAVLSAFLLAASLGIRTTVARSATIVAVNSSETCERCKSRQKKICNYAESACKHRAKAAYYYAIGRCGTSKDCAAEAEKAYNDGLSLCANDAGGCNLAATDKCPQCNK
jgi:hypothetical protein